MFEEKKKLVLKYLTDKEAWTLVTCNIVVMIVAIIQKWSLGPLMVIYCIQSVGIGLIWFLRIVSLKEFSRKGLNTDWKLPKNPTFAKLQLAVYFLFHYSLFHVIIGMMLVVDYKVQISTGIIVIGAAFFAEELFGFVRNRHPFKEKPNIGKLMFFPYMRIVPMFGMLEGAKLLQQHFNLNFESRIALLLFMSLKTITDLVMHIREQIGFGDAPNRFEQIVTGFNRGFVPLNEDTNSSWANEYTKPKIHILLARTEPIAVIFSSHIEDQTRITRWNLATDELEHGSVLKGALNPQNCDLSFDGKYLLYSAASLEANFSWTAISTPPKTKGHIIWEFTHPQRIPGMFISHDTLWMNMPKNEVAKLQKNKPIPYKIKTGVYEKSKTDLLTAKLKNKGWTLSKKIENTSDNLVYEKILQKRYRLKMILSSYSNHTDAVYSLTDMQTEKPLNKIITAESIWADCDRSGNLIVADAELIRRYGANDISIQKPNKAIPTTEIKGKLS